MAALILDSEALSALASGPRTRREIVRGALTVARRRGEPVVIPAAILAELLRGAPHDAAVNAALNREALEVIDIGRRIARTAGRLLGTSGLDSQAAIDAFVAATAVALGGGVIATGDPTDLRRLSSGHANVKVVPI